MKAIPRSPNGGGCKATAIVRPHASLPHACPEWQRGAGLMGGRVSFFFTLRVDKMRENGIERLPTWAVVKYGH